MITSENNQSIKKLLKLKNLKQRQRLGEFIIEGKSLIDRAVRNNIHIVEVYLREDTDKYITAFPNAVILSRKLFDHVADTQSPQGVIAVAKMFDTTLCQIEKITGRVLILENIQDPGNMGTIIRTAHAVGCDCIIVSKGCVDIYSPKTVRATCGSIFSVKMIESSCLEDSIAHLKSLGYFIYASCPNPNGHFYDSVGMDASVFVIGNESNGVSQHIIDLCDGKIAIPMPGGANSLNAAVAAAVLLYEHLRRNI